MEIRIKKDSGIETIVKEFQEQEVESVKEIKESNRFSSLIERSKKYNWNNVLQMKSDIKEILKPYEIAAFLELMQGREEKIDSVVISHFFKTLIQKSYEAGNNDFVFNDVKSILSVASEIEGRKEDVLKIQVRKVQNLFGAYSNHILVKGEYAKDGLGESAKNSRFVFEQVGEWCGPRAENCYFEMKKVGAGVGSSSIKSTFVVLEEYYPQSYGFEYKNNHPRKCTYKTPKNKVLEKFLETIPKGNQLVFITPEGKDIIIRDFDER